MAEIKGMFARNPLYEVVISQAEWQGLQNGLIDGGIWFEVQRTLDVLGNVSGATILTTKPHAFDNTKGLALKDVSQFVKDTDH